jgi:hypothetical protein
VNKLAELLVTIGGLALCIRDRDFVREVVGID